MGKFNYRLAAIFLSLALGGIELDAKSKHQKPELAKLQDEIVVEAHIQVAPGAITRFVATQHYSRSYVYAERKPGEPVTLIDITDLTHPNILSQVALNTKSGVFIAAAGTAVLAEDAVVGPAQGTDASGLPMSRTITLMDFSNPAQPKVTRQLDGVTAVQKLANGSVILLANKEGVWILREHFAEDPAVEERYAKEVVYGQSMY